MAKSRKGKKSIKAKLIKDFEKTINNKFEECPITKRKELFLELENWAKNELNEECCEMFLTALYNAKATESVRMEMALDKAIQRIRGQ